MNALTRLVSSSYRAEPVRYVPLSSSLIEMAEERSATELGRQCTVHLRVRVKRRNILSKSFYDLPSIEDGDALMASVSLERLRDEQTISPLQYDILANAIDKARVYTACDAAVADYIA